MNMIRAFFAIDLPHTLQNDVCDVIKQLHKIEALQCRWIEPQHFHITLQFLKEVQTDDIARMLQNVCQTIQTIRPFEIELNHIECFPNARRPRYITLIPDFNDPLIQMLENI